MPILLTIWIAKAIIILSRLSGRGGGSALPGLVAERLNTRIGSVLASRIRLGSFVVSGTNGKTTTSKMALKILGDHGMEVITNRAGSNLSRGIVSALIDHASWSGKMPGELGLFEVDEAALPAVTSMLQPKSIMVLNLFRDQLDRYGELDTTASIIGTAIAQSHAVIYLNADDPLVASLGRYARNPDKVHYFGLRDAPISRISQDITADSIQCPVCETRLKFTKTFFGHIGHYKCPKGDYIRPEPEYAASAINLTAGGASFDLTLGDQSAGAKIYLPGTYNVYNALGASVIADRLGVALPSIVQSLPLVTAAFGRVERIVIDGKILYLLLVKNPTGFNQVIQTFLTDKGQRLLIAINDLFADGRDVSWLWDVSFEELAGRGHVVSVTGIRAADMALRLKYAGVKTSRMTSDSDRALQDFIDSLPVGGTGYITPTYTAMRDIRARLGKRVKLAGEWE